MSAPLAVYEALRRHGSGRRKRRRRGGFALGPIVSALTPYAAKAASEAIPWAMGHLNDYVGQANAYANEKRHALRRHYRSRALRRRHRGGGETLGDNQRYLAMVARIQPGDLPTYQGPSVS